jgi:C-terminal processing protease CtpA/Prc
MDLSRQLRALLIGLSLALSACGGGGGGDAEDDGDTAGETPVESSTCSDASQKDWLLSVTRDWYFFRDLLPADLNPADYETASELLNALTATARAQGKDRYFSYVTTQQADEARFEGQQNAGFGFRLGLTSDDRLFLLESFEATAAAEAGMIRGTEILAIDAGAGYRSISSWLSTDPTLSEALGPSETGVTRGFRYRIATGDAVTENTLVKNEYEIDPIPNQGGAQILPLQGTAGVGYLNFRSFVSTADSQLTTAFDSFRQAGVSDFIIDLRYNGGGLVSTEETFEDLLAAALDGRVSHAYEFNDRHTNYNETRSFAAQPQSVAPVRIAFITTGGTASASELLINSFAPYVSVAIIGADTYGKPVGQSAFDMDGCDTRLRLVSFRTVNSQGQGDYYNGLASELPYACSAYDDVLAAQGDPNEDSTAQAMHWLQNGACAATISASATTSKRSQTGIRFVPGASPDERLPGVN